MPLTSRLVALTSPMLGGVSGCLGLLRAPRLRLSGDSAASAGAPSIRITEECGRRLAELHRTQGRYLRVSVEGGGCSGFQYKFQLDDLPPLATSQGSKNGDRIIEASEGAKVIVDTESLDLLRGCTLDYQRELIREGFKITANPQAEKGCSCGTSFAVRMD